MTPFKFSFPPKSPGVYAIKHEPTGRLYVGSSVNLLSRFNEWRAAFTQGFVKGKKMRDAIQFSKLEDWTFWVLAVVETRNEALAKEADLITGMRNLAPELLLNGNTPSVPDEKEKGPAFTAATPIVDHSGRKYSYDEAAEELGVAKKTLTKRLSKWRARGVQGQVTLESLREKKIGRPALTRVE